MNVRAYIFIIMGVVALLFAGCNSEEWEFDGETAEQTTAGFQWTRAEDVETHSKFLRNFGLGYSYDAVRGSYCDWQDIRCQVINRYFVEFVQRVSGDPLIHTSTARRSDINQTFEYFYWSEIISKYIYAPITSKDAGKTIRIEATAISGPAQV